MVVGVGMGRVDSVDGQTCRAPGSLSASHSEQEYCTHIPDCIMGSRLGVVPVPIRPVTQGRAGTVESTTDNPTSFKQYAMHINVNYYRRAHLCKPREALRLASWEQD